jgi:hypothetical protein
VFRFRFYLFLKAVQDENSFLEANSVDRAVSPARIIFDYLKHSGAAKAFQQFLAGSRRSPFCAKCKGCPKNFRTRTGRAIRSFLLLPI